MIRVCERHGGNVIPPGEDLCVACQREQEEREHPPPCQHRRILYVCADCGELEPRSPGYLYPVLTDQDGRILDGRARLAAGRPGRPARGRTPAAFPARCDPGLTGSSRCPAAGRRHGSR